MEQNPPPNPLEKTILDFLAKLESIEVEKVRDHENLRKHLEDRAASSNPE